MGSLLNGLDGGTQRTSKVEACSAAQRRCDALLLGKPSSLHVPVGSGSRISSNRAKFTVLGTFFRVLRNVVGDRG